MFIIHLSVYNLFLFPLQIHSISCAFFCRNRGELWDKVEVCSLLKAFHVPIASHKVHYTGMEGGGGGPRDAQEHTQGRKDCFGLKIAILFKLLFGSL